MRCSLALFLSLWSVRWFAEAFLLPRSATPAAFTAWFGNFALHSPFQTPKTNGKTTTDARASPFLTGTSNSSHDVFPSYGHSPEVDKRLSMNTLSSLSPAVSSTSNLFSNLEANEKSLMDTLVAAPSNSGTISPSMDLPRVDDLNRNLELLRHELEEKNQRFRQTVQNLQAESDRTLASVQQWDEYYRSKMDEICDKATKAEQTLQAREQSFQTQVLQLQQESARKDITAAQKVYWLAEQLQKFKFQAHQQELEEELAACNKYLQSKLEKLQADLEHQVKLTESERAKHGDLWKQRVALETEVAAIQKELQKSITDLKERLNEEKHQRQREKQLHQDQLAQQEAQLQKQLREVKEQSAAVKADLQSSLQIKDAQYNQTLELLKQEAEKEASLTKESLAAEQAKLLGVLRQKEKELADQIALTTAASEKASIQWTKRIELEKELSTMKHEYERAVEDWKSRFEALENLRTNELSGLKRLLAQRESEAAEMVRVSIEESKAHKAASEESLKAKDTHYGQLIQEVRQASEHEKQNLHESLTSIRNELERFKVENDLRLVAAKKAFQTKQDEVLSKIASKEEELRKQASLTTSLEETTKLHLQKREELENELSRQQRKHDASISEWEDRLKSLQHERIMEQQRMEAVLAETKEHARVQVEAARRETEERRVALEESLGLKDAQLRLELQLLLDSSHKTEQEMSNKIQSLTNELQLYEVESQRQLTEAKEAAEAKQNELRALLSDKEKQYSEQVEHTAAAENRSRVEFEQRSKLEEEVSSLKASLGALEEEKRRLHESLESLSHDLQRHKDEKDQRLTVEQKVFQTKQDELVSELASKEEELHKQIALTASTEETSKIHWQRREELERELSELKYKHDTSISEWERQFKSLQQDSIFEQQKMEALLAQTKEKARVRVEAARREAEEKTFALENSLAAKDTQILHDLQALLDSSLKKEQEMNNTIQSLTSEFQQYKMESHRQLAAAKEGAEEKLNELRALIATKEIQYNEQAKIAEAAQNTSRVESDQRSKLEAELSSVKVNFERHVAQWESRYNSLLESRDTALQKAEALLARKEADSRNIIDSISSELEAAKTAYADSLRAKDQVHDLRIQETRASSENKLQELHQELKEVTASYQQFKSEARQLIDQLTREAETAKTNYADRLKAKDQDLELRLKEVRAFSENKLYEMQQELKAAVDVHEQFKIESQKSLVAEKEASLKKQEELHLQILKKEKELADQVAMTTAHQSRAEELLLAKRKRRRSAPSGSVQFSRAELEIQLSSLQKKYESDAVEWAARYKTLQTLQKDAGENMATSALLERTKAEADQKLQAVTEEAQNRQRELKSEIQAQAVRHSQAMQEIIQASQTKEAELKQQLHVMESKLTSFEAKAREALETEKTASLAKQVELVTQIEQSQRHLERVLELYAKEKGKNGL